MPSLCRKLERVHGDVHRFEEMQQAARRELAAIEDAEVEIGGKQIQAANEPALSALLVGHDTEKKKAEMASRLGNDLTRLLTERQSVEAVLSANEVAATDTVQGATVLISLFDTEIARLAGIDLDSLRARLTTARALVELDSQRAKAQAKLENMQKLSADLTREVEDLTREGLPAERQSATRASRTSLQQGAAAALGVAAQTEIRARQLRALEQSLRGSEFGELCPTCARPFQPGEATATLNALSEQVKLLDEEVLAERRIAEQKNREAAALVDIENRLAADTERYQNLAGRLENGRSVIESQEREVATYALELGRRLRESQRKGIPEQTEIVTLDQEVQRAAAEQEQRPRLEMNRERLIDSIERQQSIEQQIRVLGTIAYDQEAHQRDYAAWSLARDAVARIEELRKLVARRPDREAALTQSRARLVELATERSGIEAAIAALAFVPTELTSANQLATEALDRERTATETAHVAETSLNAANRARADLDAFEARLTSLDEESIAAQREHTELHRVYTEFARFEKFVALVVTPHLGEVASELLATVTEGKYDRLEFTEDYGIEVYDGEDDRFPLNQYSGGERDVIALCARLALSQVIGGQATTPIQFMVLDEVFGSLDLDRRRNLMEMLQRLMEENQAFQQLFVISHVDDVKAGAMFDEVWRVVEAADGVSQLEQVSVTGALEDY